MLVLLFCRILMCPLLNFLEVVYGLEALVCKTESEKIAFALRSL